MQHGKCQSGVEGARIPDCECEKNLFVPALPFEFGGQTRLLSPARPLIMGILNVTPDSFSDGGLFATHESAVAHACAMAEAGADIIDIGGESTRPGAAPVSAADEIARVVPVIRELTQRLKVPLSIDTAKSAVAAAAVAAGAVIVNDVSGFQYDPDMPRVVSDTGAGYILMHMRGTPETMQADTAYEDIIQELLDFFTERLEKLTAAGVAFSSIVLDPGIGFGKNAAQNLLLIRECRQFRALKRPVLLGPSRKSFIGGILNGAAPARRLWGTAAAVACGVVAGADIFRVHDVRQMRETALVAAAICSD